MFCHICNNKTDFFLEKDGYTYQKCPLCGLVFVHPQPDTETLSREVYSEEACYQKHKDKDLSTVKENAHYKKILDYVESALGPRTFIPKFSRTLELVEHAPTSEHLRLLDVGCSSGEFLYSAKQKGFEVYGVELNPLTAQIAIANGLNVKIGILADARFADNFFDVIFWGDIIEHVPSPRALLIECKRLLKSGGTLIVSTPNLDCFWAWATFKFYTWFSIPWSVLTPPHHLFQFSENNLKMFLKETGFSPIAVWFRRPPRLTYELGSLHLWGKFKKEKTMKNFLCMLFAFALYTKLYLLDLLITPLKKKDCGMIIVFKNKILKH